MMCDCRGFDGEQERQDAVNTLGVVDTPVDDPRFNAITKLMASIFQTPVALITLITEDRVWFKSKVGPFGVCVTREGSWCNYISVPNTPEVLITEDASEDARFSANPYVAGAPFIKFYAGAPLVGKNGMRYGTLCVVDLKRRSFSAEMYALLINFANLVVQELERDAASMREVADEAAATSAGQQAIERMLAASQTSVALVDVRSRSWPLLYANSAFVRDEGADSAEACTGAGGLWDLFEPADAADKVRARVCVCLWARFWGLGWSSPEPEDGSCLQVAPASGLTQVGRARGAWQMCCSRHAECLAPQTCLPPRSLLPAWLPAPPPPLAGGGDARHRRGGGGGARHARHPGLPPHRAPRVGGAAPGGHRPAAAQPGHRHPQLGALGEGAGAGVPRG
jgi:hypothetical protein